VRRLDRLEEVVGEAHLDGAGLLAPGQEPGNGQDGHRGPGGQGAHLLDQVEAVDVRQEQVLKDEVRRLRRQHGQRRLAVRRFQDPVALTAQGDPDHLAGDGVVFDDQNGGWRRAHGGPSSPPGVLPR
jgi:hypothetical protein